MTPAAFWNQQISMADVMHVEDLLAAGWRTSDIVAELRELTGVGREVALAVVARVALMQAAAA